jgi:hypothetical protein
MMQQCYEAEKQFAEKTKYFSQGTRTHYMLISKEKTGNSLLEREPPVGLVNHEPKLIYFFVAVEEGIMFP